MFKILYRTFVILLVAVLVSVGLYWFSVSSSGQAMFFSGGAGRRGGEHFNAGGQTNLFGQGQPGANRPPRGGDFGGGRGDRGGGINLARGLGDIPGKIAVIAGITVVVVMVRKLPKLFARKTKAESSPDPA
jgi:hypothetical protein